MNLKQYLLSLHPRDKQRLRPVIITEMVSALSCLHNHGAVHSDVKFDNFMVYFKPDNPDAIKLKIIDMGLAAVSRNSKPLVTFKSTPNANFLNTTRLVELLEQAFKTIADSGGGLFANTVLFARTTSPLQNSIGVTSRCRFHEAELWRVLLSTILVFSLTTFNMYCMTYTS